LSLVSSLNSLFSAQLFKANAQGRIAARALIGAFGGGHSYVHVLPDGLLLKLLQKQLLIDLKKQLGNIHPPINEFILDFRILK
jgi:hypothetical protein